MFWTRNYNRLSDWREFDRAFSLLDTFRREADHAGRRTSRGDALLNAEMTEDAEESGKGECVYHRAFKIPRSVDESKIDASLKLGVLELHLPKREALKPRQIFVRTD